MKIAIYGATGNVGRAIVAEAAARGHEVSAFSRHEGALPSGVEWQFGDLGQVDSVAKVAADHDVVVSAVGPSREPGGDPSSFASVIARAADAVGTTRLVVVGGAGSLLTADGVRLVDTAEFPVEYKPEALATAAALDLLRNSQEHLDWTYLSPAPLFPAGDPVGAYVIGLDSPAGASISAADYALALVDEMERPAHRRARFTVAAPAA